MTALDAGKAKKVKVGDVINVGLKLCRDCNKPHSEIVLEVENGRVVSSSWASEDGNGHAYRSISDAEFIDALKARVAELEGAIKKVVDQFNTLKDDQHELLIEGQTLESASENWDAATMGKSIDFTPLLEVMALTGKAVEK